MLEADRPAVMLAATENAAAHDAKLPQISRWEWCDGAIVGSLPAGATHVFFVSDGRRNPVDQIEVFKPWLDAQRGERARVLCVVNYIVFG